MEGKLWESQTLLQIGRLESLDIPLDDTSVSRKHATIRATDRGWFLKHLNNTSGTFRNGTRLRGEECRLEARDIPQFGSKATFLVDLLEKSQPPQSPLPDQMLIEASTHAS